MPRFALLVLLALLSCTTRAAAGEVTIYRCTDAKGRLTLRDSPCARGEQQETRTMLRPKDAPPGAAITPTVAVPVPAPIAPPQVIVVSTPRPLYECVRPDGSTYTSDSGDGEPRWVPLWTLGFPVAPNRLALGDRIGAPTPLPPTPSHPPRPPLPGVFPGPIFPAGTWVRDACHALPQAEVCARLRDRRDVIRRRFFNAQPTERATLNVEERGINARLANDCGVY